MDVATGHCLQTGVPDAVGGLTMQPQCNVPNDSKVLLLSLSPKSRTLHTGAQVYDSRCKAATTSPLLVGYKKKWGHEYVVLILLATPADLGTDKRWSPDAASHINLHHTCQHW